MAVSMAGFALNDTLIKLASAELDLFQAVFLRGLMVTAVIGALAWARGALSTRPRGREVRILALRLAAEIGATLCFLTALFNMPIANATAILQSLPLAVTLAGALVMGERVGWRRYGAIALGFAGVMVIVRPGGEGFNAYSLWALAAVLCVVVRDLATRRLDPATPSLFVASLTAVAITVTAGLGTAAGDWTPVTGDALMLLAGAAVFLVFGYLFSVMTMRQGEIAVSAPFRYTNLIWAILLGQIVFDDPLDGWTLAGAALVVATGLYTFHRERRLQPAPHRTTLRPEAPDPRDRP